MIFSHYTLRGWTYNVKDPYNSAFVHAMKARLRTSLSTLQPRLEIVLGNSLEQLTSGRRLAGGTMFDVGRVYVN